MTASRVNGDEGAEAATGPGRARPNTAPTDMSDDSDRGYRDAGPLEISGPALDPRAWADWISEDIVQRLFALRQDLAEASLDNEYREDLRREILAIVAELRALAVELRSGASVHSIPPPDLVHLLQAVSGALRQRSALQRVAKASSTADLQQVPEVDHEATVADERSRSAAQLPVRPLLLQINDRDLVKALRRAGHPLSALELRSALSISRSTPSPHLTLALGEAVRRGVIQRTGQRRGTRYVLPSRREVTDE